MSTAISQTAMLKSFPQDTSIFFIFLVQRKTSNVLSLQSFGSPTALHSPRTSATMRHSLLPDTMIVRFDGLNYNIEIIWAPDKARIFHYILVKTSLSLTFGLVKVFINQYNGIFADLTRLIYQHLSHKNSRQLS